MVSASCFDIGCLPLGRCFVNEGIPTQVAGGGWRHFCDCIGISDGASITHLIRLSRGNGRSPLANTSRLARWVRFGPKLFFFASLNTWQLVHAYVLVTNVGAPAAA